MQSRSLEASSPEIELVQKPYIVHCTNILFVLQTTLAIGLANCYSAREGGKEKSGATSVSCFFFLSPPSPPPPKSTNSKQNARNSSSFFPFLPLSGFPLWLISQPFWGLGAAGVQRNEEKGGGGKEDLTAFFPDSATHKQKKASLRTEEGRKSQTTILERKEKESCRSVAPKDILPDSPSFLFPPRSCMTLRRFSQTKHSPSSSPDEEGETILSPSLLKNLVFHKQTERDREEKERTERRRFFLSRALKPCFPAWLASSFSP